MLHKLKKSNQGFTIIEVLIVLAIAGLILLVVFLAVPALQRNQRNTARKQDASRIGGSVTNFVSNNNGTLPSTVADLTTICKDAGTLGQYNFDTGTAGNCLRVATAAANNTLSIISAPGTTVAAITNKEAAQVVTKSICNSAVAGGTTNVNANTRSIALQYTIEQSGGSFVGACLNVN